MRVMLSLALSGWLVVVQADQDREQEDFLVRQAGATVNLVDIDSIADNIPDELRLGVMDDPNRIAGYLQTIVLHRAVAEDARRQGLDQDPLIQREIQIMAEGILAKHHVRRSVAAMPQPDYERLAHEHYRVHRDKFRRPDTVDVSHILISDKTRDEEQALARASEVRQKLIDDAGALERLVAEYSDDPSAATNRGRFRNVKPGQMASAFEAAAFALTEPGAITEPVKTQFGYHVIVLHARRPGEQLEFDKVKGAIIADLKKKHEEQMSADFLDRFRAQPMEVNEEAVLALRTRYADPVE